MINLFEYLCPELYRLIALVVRVAPTVMIIMLLLSFVFLQLKIIEIGGY